VTDEEWVARRWAEPVHPLWLGYDWTVRTFAGPAVATPPAALRGFEDGHWLVSVRLSFPLVPIPSVSWRSPDGRILAITMFGKVFLTSHLRSGSAVTTFPDDSTGRELAAARGPLALVGGEDPVARHTALLDLLEAQGDAAIRFRSRATQRAADRLYNRHDAQRSTVVKALSLVAMSALALVLPVVLALVVLAFDRLAAPPCEVRLPLAPAGGEVGAQLGQWCAADRRGVINAVAPLDAGRLLLASASDGLSVVDLRTGVASAWSDGAGWRDHGPFAAQALPGGEVAIGYGDGRLEVRSAADGSVRSERRGLGELRQVVPLPDGSLASFAKNGTVAVTRVEERLASVDLGQSWCGGVAADGTLWACRHGELVHLDGSLRELERVPLPFRATWGLSIGADGRVWAVGDPAGVSVWDGATRTDVPVTPGARATWRTVAATSRGAVVGTWAGELVFVDERGELGRTRAASNQVQSVWASPDGGWVVAAGRHGMVSFHAAP
jgi:hypothetical protein